jgi:hypothetical protein
VVQFTAIFFDEMKNGDGLIERLAAAIGRVIFREGVNRESLAVDLFPVALHGAVGRD